MGSKSDSFMLYFALIPLLFMLIFSSCSLSCVWMKTKGDQSAFTKVTLSKMEVVTYNMEQEKRTTTIDLSKACDIDESNVKCVLYKGSKATKALTGVTIALTIATAAVSVLVGLCDMNKDCVEISAVLHGALSSITVIFSLITVVVYTSYSSDFPDEYGLATGWILSLISALVGSVITLVLSCMNVCMNVK